jgi:hypothetical protein
VKIQRNKCAPAPWDFDFADEKIYSGGQIKGMAEVTKKPVSPMPIMTAKTPFGWTTCAASRECFQPTA